MPLTFELLLDSELCGETTSAEGANKPECDSAATSTNTLEAVEILEQTAVTEELPAEAELPKH